MPPPPIDAPAPPPIDADRIGPDSLKTDERIPPSPPAALPPLESSDEWPPPELPDDDDPDEPPRTPLLNEPNFCVIAEIFGEMMPEMRAWKLGIGWGVSMLCCLFFSMLPLSNWSMNRVFASMNWSSFYNRRFSWNISTERDLTIKFYELLSFKPPQNE